MKNTVSSLVEKFKRAKKARRRAASIITALALVVSCGVFWELRADGLAMANETLCGQEEHVHDGSCCEEVPVCGLEEEDGHLHDESCYEEMLVCEIPEHVHTMDCLTDETADVETAEDWEATLPEELSGFWGEDVVSVAESQLGYAESGTNFRLDEDGETRQGYTRYGAWYGNEYGDWDAMFASFCLCYAGVPESVFPQAAGVYAWISRLESTEDADESGETVLLAQAQGYIPKPGDLVFFDNDEEDNLVNADGSMEAVSDHVGIVEAVRLQSDGQSLERLWVIEGDLGDEVQRAAYDFMSEEPEDMSAVAAITGYGVLPENPDMAEDDEALEELIEEDEAVKDAVPEVKVNEAEEIGTLEGGAAALAAGSSGLVIHFTRIGGGYAGLCVNLADTEENPLSGSVVGDYEVEMPYEINMKEFAKNYVNVYGDYMLAYATMTDPNYGDTEHEPEFNEPGDGEIKVGSNEGYGSRENPVTSITISSTEPENGDASKTWHYEIKFEDGTKVIVPVYGNANGGYDNGGIGRYCPKYLEINLYFISEPYVITWEAGSNSSNVSYLSYETRDRNTDELLGGSESWEKTKTDTAVAMTQKGLLQHIDLPGYTYSYAAVSDPGGEVYGSADEPVTEIWAAAEAEADGGSIWTYSIRSDGKELASLSKAYAPRTEDGFDPERDLMITLYYSDNDPVKNVALDSRCGSGNYGGRDYISGLLKYADSNGNITINLPDNESLGKDFVVYRDEAGGKEVTVNASEIYRDGFDWSVAGWYNIATDSYVDVSEGPASVKINLNDDNVFYADITAADYDAGSSNDNDLIESDMTGDFVTVKLFDYNELFNLYSCELTRNGIESESWDAGRTSFASGGSRLYPVPVLENNVSEWHAAGKDIAKSFVFTNDGYGVYNLPYPANLNAWNEWTGNSVAAEVDNNGNQTGRMIRYQLSSAAFNWNVDSKESDLIKMLFDESGDTYGVHYIGRADGLFQFGDEGDELHIEDVNNPLNNQDYDFNGYYYYTSAVNGASYNRSEERFYLHDHPETYSRYTMFLPFNPYKRNFGAGELDYWFGMEMEVDFYLPGATGELATDGSGNVTDGQYLNVVGEEEMKFFFTGDDDIMVFVDDELVLDMAGIHDEAVGWINFATGEYYYHCLDQVNGTSGGRYEGYFTGLDVSPDKQLDGTYAEPLKLEAGRHTLTVYYMERGAGASNLTVSFNIMPSWRYYSDETTTVTAKKEWSDGNENHEGESVTMGLFEEVLEGDEISGREIYFDEETGKSYALVDETLLGDSGSQRLSDENGWFFAWEMLDNSRSYIVRELEAPEGYISESSFTAFDKWKYWSIIGESEFEDMFERAEEEFWVILTDAAAGWDESEGYPVRGNVVKNTISDGVESVAFSEAPIWFTYSGDGFISAEFGEIPDTQISGKNLKWMVEFTGETSHDEEYLNKVHTFYLASEDSPDQYIYVTNDKTLRKRKKTNGNPTAFYFDDLGELRVDGTHERVVYVEGAEKGYELQVTASSDVAESKNDNHNIRLYTLSDIDTYGTAFWFLNTKVSLLPNTGGPGRLPIASAGLLIFAAAGACLLLRNNRVPRPDKDK